MGQRIRRSVASAIAGMVVFAMGAGVAGAEVNAVRVEATRTVGCDYSIALEVVGEPETVVITGDRPTRMSVPGDTQVEPGDFGAGVELAEGIYEIHWDGSEFGDKTIDFTVIVDGVAVFEPVEIQICENLDSIAEQAAYEKWLESAPEVAPADPPVTNPCGTFGFGFGFGASVFARALSVTPTAAWSATSFGAGATWAAPNLSVAFVLAPTPTPTPTPTPPADPCGF